MPKDTAMAKLHENVDLGKIKDFANNLRDTMSSDSGVVHKAHSAVELSRDLWYASIDPSSSKEASLLNRSVLRETFPMLGAVLMVGAEKELKRKVMAPKDAPTFKELVKQPKGTCLTSQINYVSAISYGSLFASLMNRKESYFTVAVMAGGYSFGAQVEATLRARGKSSGFALVGCSIGCYTQHYFNDGSPVHDGKVHLLEEDIRLLERNKNKPALIVDDAIVTGETVIKVEASLRKIGFKEVLKIMYDEPRQLYL